MQQPIFFQMSVLLCVATHHAKEIHQQYLTAQKNMKPLPLHKLQTINYYSHAPNPLSPSTALKIQRPLKKVRGKG